MLVSRCRSAQVPASCLFGWSRLRLHKQTPASRRPTSWPTSRGQTDKLQPCSPRHYSNMSFAIEAPFILRLASKPTTPAGMLSWQVPTFPPNNCSAYCKQANPTRIKYRYFIVRLCLAVRNETESTPHSVAASSSPPSTCQRLSSSDAVYIAIFHGLCGQFSAQPSAAPLTTCLGPRDHACGRLRRHLQQVSGRAVVV